MFVDRKTGNVKKPKEGKCMVCNGPEEVRSFGAGFCLACMKAMSNEGELAKRIVWD